MKINDDGPRPKLAATLQDSLGNLLADGAADIPPDFGDVTFYPQDATGDVDVLIGAAVLVIHEGAQRTIDLTKGRFCESSSGSHFHFSIAD